MASWIIVTRGGSLDCQTGVFPVSARNITTNAISAKSMLGAITRPVDVAALTRAVRFVPPSVSEMTNIVIKVQAQFRAAIIISLLLPSPPNALATSRPASIMKKFASANSPSITSMSPTELKGLNGRNTGMKRAAVIVSSITDAKRNIRELCRNNFILLQQFEQFVVHGWRTLEPLRFCVLAFTFRIIPVISGARASIEQVCNTPRTTFAISVALTASATPNNVITMSAPPELGKIPELS